MKRQLAKELLEYTDLESNAKPKQNAIAATFWIKMKNVAVLENLSINALSKRLKLSEEK